jgi:hypothetical protein
MKYLSISSLIFLFLFSSCSKKDETKLEAFSPEAFAYDIGGAFEVNASTRVKGFQQKEENKKFKASLAFDIDIVKPNGDTIKSMITRVEDKINDEKMTDVPLEIQFNLDSTYALGKYKLIFDIKDVNTKQTTTSSAAFDLSE